MAVLPPAEALADLDVFLEPRREAGAFRWTLPEQVHLTLAFVREAAEYRLDELAERLETLAQRYAPFTVQIAGGGAFPQVSGARVLWAGLDTKESGPELNDLARGARAAANRSGLVVDGQRFRPHLTVARLSRPTEMTRWVQLLDAYAGPEWDVDRLTLVASHLGEGPRRRPRYEVLSEHRLGG